MSKVEYKCCVCDIVKEKYPSQVRGKRFYCSPACRYTGMSVHGTGENNPNYKGGVHCTESICDCGKIKDYRARQCTVCRGGLQLNVQKFFKEDTVVRNATLWRYIKSLDLIPWKSCLWCGLGWEWNGRQISLQLDHINGKNSDNRVDNLRVLCPNCHTQTDTYAAKNRRKK